MTELFIGILNMSITASYVILAILLLRLALKGLPKKYSYLLWSVAGFRLVCPVSFKSVFSLFSLKLFDMNKAQSVNENALTYIQDNAASKAGEVTVGIPSMNAVVANGVTSTSAYKNAVNPILLTLTVIWACGILALLIYSAINFIKLKKHLSTSILIEKGVYQSENISSPFIVGIIRPRIYVPSGINDGYKSYILSHERYHIKRFDNGTKLLAYFLLVLHWFNPLVWLAFYLMTKDMEMSCDEAVISKNADIKKTYSSALLSFATNKRFPAPSPISFSENGVKARIKNVLHYRQPKKILQVVAIILCIALLTACAANPKQTVTEELFDDFIIETNIYTAGDTIAESGVLSSHIDNGRYFKKITIDKDKLTVEDFLGDIFESTKSENVSVEIEKAEGNLYYINKNMVLFYSEYSYLFDDLESITAKKYSDTANSYIVYSNNDGPFAIAIGDNLRIFRLEPYNFDSIISDVIIEQEKDKLDDDYFGEAHRIMDVYDGDLDGNNKGEFVTAYIQLHFMGLNLKNDRVSEGSGTVHPAAIVFSKNGNKYKSKQYWTPRDGSDFDKDLKRYMPKSVYEQFHSYYYTNEVTEDLIKEAYAQIIEKNMLDTDAYLETAFNEYDLTDNTYEAHEVLIGSGEYTLKYVFNKYLFGEAESRLDEKYLAIMKELTEYKSSATDGKSYLLAYLEHCKDEYYDTDIEEIRSTEPYAALILEMSGNVGVYTKLPTEFQTYRLIPKEKHFLDETGNTVKTRHGDITLMNDDAMYAGVIGFDSKNTNHLEYTYGNGIKQILFSTGYDLKLYAFINDSVYFSVNGNLYRMELRFNANDKVEYRELFFVYEGNYYPVDAQTNKLILSNGKKEITLNTNSTRITLTDAKAFIKNGDKAKLSDFEKYEHREEGSGLYIYRLPLAENKGELVVASGGGEIVYMDLYNETAHVIDSYFRDTTKFNTKADISEEQAEQFAKLQLKEDYGSKADGFVLESVKLYQANEGQFIITSNPSGNPYYEVTYSDTNEVSYFVNYFIDSSTGEIIWSNTISD